MKIKFMTATEAVASKQLSPMVFIHYLLEEAGFTKREIDRVYKAYDNHINRLKSMGYMMKGKNLFSPKPEEEVGK